MTAYQRPTWLALSFIAAWAIPMGLVPAPARGQGPTPAPSPVAASASSLERGVGPFQLQTRRGAMTVRLLRRDQDFVWLDQLVSSGRYVETGVPTPDIVKLDMVRPRAMAEAQTELSAEAASNTVTSLRRLFESLRPFRDLPGVPAEEVLMLQAGLMERQERWRDAAALYEDVSRQAHAAAWAPEARLRAGMCRAAQKQFAEALAYLDQALPTDENVEFLSEVLLARGAARAATGRHDEAVMDYLQLVVFYPYTGRNEARGLAGALPSFAALGDWDAAWKAMEALRACCSGTPEAAQADEFARAHEKQLAAEGLYQEPAPAQEESEHESMEKVE